jgi:mycothiol synthase
MPNGANPFKVRGEAMNGKNQIMTEKPLLDSSLSLRTATFGDVHAVADLIYAVCEADGDVTVAVTPENLEHAWREDGFNPGTDAFIVETDGGRIVGYEELSNEQAHAHFSADGYVHPDFKGRGIGTLLLTRAEERIREMMMNAKPELRVYIHASTDGKDNTGHEMFKSMGYGVARYFWRMGITLDSAPEYSLPAGVEFRPFDKDAHARLVWKADNEAFGEHWGNHDSTYEEWAYRKLERPEFDPSLWLVAWDGGEIAGFSQNRFRMGIGWVGTLGVRKPWRKKGLGLALLHASFADFYRCGMKTVGLGVDASNTTGATRLYERAGMSIASEFVTFEKELRPGRGLDE